MGTLINPTRPTAQDAADFLPEPVYLQNPTTGMIFRITHRDTLARCLREFYTPSTYAAMREQAVELAELQGRPLPTWARPAEEAAPAAAPAPAPEPGPDPDEMTPPHRAAALRAEARR